MTLTRWPRTPAQHARDEAYRAQQRDVARAMRLAGWKLIAGQWTAERRKDTR